MSASKCVACGDPAHTTEGDSAGRCAPCSRLQSLQSAGFERMGAEGYCTAWFRRFEGCSLFVTDGNGRAPRLTDERVTVFVEDACREEDSEALTLEGSNWAALLDDVASARHGARTIVDALFDEAPALGVEVSL